MKPIDMKAAKKRLEQKKHSSVVLDAFDKLNKNHEKKLLAKRAEIEYKAKKQL